MFNMMPFSYIDIHDFLQLIHRGDYPAVTNVQAYFRSWPVAMESRPLFGIRYDGVQGVFERLPFGGAPCPYLAFTMTAELCAGFRGLGIDVCGYICAARRGERCSSPCIHVAVVPCMLQYLLWSVLGAQGWRVTSSCMSQCLRLVFHMTMVTSADVANKGAALRNRATASTSLVLGAQEYES